MIGVALAATCLFACLPVTTDTVVAVSVAQAPVLDGRVTDRELARCGSGSCVTAASFTWPRRFLIRHSTGAMISWSAWRPAAAARQCWTLATDNGISAELSIAASCAWLPTRLGDGGLCLVKSSQCSARLGIMPTGTSPRRQRQLGGRSSCVFEKPRFIPLALPRGWRCGPTTIDRTAGGAGQKLRWRCRRSRSSETRRSGFLSSLDRRR